MNTFFSDSYQYQIRKEREKRQELESELIDLRGMFSTITMIIIRSLLVTKKKKQESLLPLLT